MAYDFIEESKAACAAPRRGAPMGNQNARTHGFYAKKLSKKEQAALVDASDMRGVDGEIALLRVKIASVIDSDPDNVRVLTAAVTALVKLLKLKASLPEDSRSLAQTVHDALMELGKNLSLGAVLSLDKLTGLHEDVSPTPANPLPPNGENSASSQALADEIK